MKERIKEARKALSLTQTEFGARVGVKGNTITNYENGLRTPSDAVIFSICREFNIREDWLRNGTGNMFEDKTKDQELADFVSKIYSEDENSFKRRLVSALNSLSEDEWKLLADIAEKISKEKD